MSITEGEAKAAYIAQEGGTDAAIVTAYPVSHPYGETFTITEPGTETELYSFGRRRADQTVVSHGSL